MRAVEFSVTAEDIRMGDRGNCYACAAARAVTRVLPDHLIARVADERITVVRAEGCSVVEGQWPTPANVKRFISRFDRGLPVKPITFALGWPDQDGGGK